MKKILSLLVAAALSGCTADQLHEFRRASNPIMALNEDIENGKIMVINIETPDGGATIWYRPGTIKQLDDYQSGDDLVLNIKNGKGVVIRRSK